MVFLYYLLKKNFNVKITIVFDMNDKLQAPLQPTRDNLSSEIYEIFEKDKVKYDLY